jgi:hypothetical protein
VVGGWSQPRRAIEGRVRISIEQTMPVFLRKRSVGRETATATVAIENVTRY